MNWDKDRYRFCVNLLEQSLGSEICSLSLYLQNHDVVGIDKNWLIMNQVRLFAFRILQINKLKKIWFALCFLGIDRNLSLF